MVVITPIPDAGVTPFPLDESGVDLDLYLEPLDEAVIFFKAKLTTFPNDTILTNEASVTSFGVNYRPGCKSIYISNG